MAILAYTSLYRHDPWLIALGEAARDTKRPIAVLIDELQYLPKPDLAAMIRSLHAVT